MNPIARVRAASRGVPVRLPGFGFLSLVGACAAEATAVYAATFVPGRRRRTPVPAL